MLNNTTESIHIGNIIVDLHALSKIISDLKSEIHNKDAKIAALEATVKHLTDDVPTPDPNANRYSEEWEDKCGAKDNAG